MKKTRQNVISQKEEYKFICANNNAIALIKKYSIQQEKRYKTILKKSDEIYHLSKQIENNPENKKLAVLFDKKFKAYQDSITCFFESLRQLRSIPLLESSLPYHLSALLQPDKFAEKQNSQIKKNNQKLLQKSFDKKLSKQRRLARKVKKAEQDFWLHQHFFYSKDDNFLEKLEYLCQMDDITCYDEF